jgi:hypothetical protein
MATTRKAKTAAAEPFQMKHYDTITLELGRIESLVHLLSDRLLALSEEGDVDLEELYAFSVIADTIQVKRQIVYDEAKHILHECLAYVGLKGGA